MKVNEAVLTFIRDEVASFPQPVKKLGSVQRTELAPSEEKRVLINVPKEALSFTGQDLKKRFEAGYFTVTVGNLSTRIYIK